jgi:VCBS repeat-containing protein
MRSLSRHTQIRQTRRSPVLPLPLEARFVAALCLCVSACTFSRVSPNPPDGESPPPTLTTPDPDMPTINTAPTVQLALQTLQTNEDEALTLNGSASDAEGDALTLTVETQPVHGQLVATLDGAILTLTYTPATDYNGPDALTLVVTDARGASSARVSVPIAVVPVDDPLRVSDDEVSATEDTPTPFANLLSNDADADQSEPLAITALDASSAEGASLALDQAGVVTYTPAPGFNALQPGQTLSDTFHYTVTNASGETGLGTVHVIVTGSNDAPLLDSPAISLVTCEPHLSLTPQVLAVSDADNGQPHTFERAGGDCPATFAISTSGSISGECPAVGTDCTATFSVSDGEATDTVDITLSANTVFAAPSGTGDGSSWANAMGDLQEAFDTARPAGKALWIKQGKFTPPGELTLVQQNGPAQPPPAFHIVGSFVGTESLLSQRGAPSQWTILDGGGTHRILRTRFAYLNLNGLMLQSGMSESRGGAIYAWGGEIALTDLGFLYNGVAETDAMDAIGGAVTFEAGLGTIEHCDFAFNFAANAFPSGSASGGAIALLDFASVNISNSKFVSNSLSPAEGSAASAGLEGGAGGHARGGALFNDGGSFFIDHTTFLFNEAFGAWGGNGGDGVGGAGGNGGRGGDALGGAIYTLNEQFLLSHTRFIMNSATVGRGGDGGHGDDSATGNGTPRCASTPRSPRWRSRTAHSSAIRQALREVSMRSTPAAMAATVAPVRLQADTEVKAAVAAVWRAVPCTRR